MTDKLAPEARSRVMAAVKSRETQLERLLRRALWDAGLRGWRLNVRDLPGKPDVVFRRARIAVFVDSCFWHGCAEHLRMPKSNVDYWEKKIEYNRARDATQTEKLRAMGWKVLRIWEHELTNATAVLDRLRSVLSEEQN